MVDQMENMVHQTTHGGQQIVQQIINGKNIVLKTYTKQLLMNWRINYEFLYNSYLKKFMPSTER